jgi:hypothetical protein
MTSSRSPVADADSTVTAVSETLDAWRQRGADRLDPVRFRFIEAMALRAAAHAGEARRILDERLAQLLAAYGGLVDQAERKKKAVVPPPEPGGLTELLAHIAQQTAPAIDTATASGGAPQGVAGLKSLRYFRSTWSRLSADRRLNQSQAKVPEITLMRDASPDYLNRLMAYVDTLSWIEQANASAPPSAATRPEGRKAARSKNA